MANAVQKLSPKHEAIILWLVEHPTEPLRACAQHFNVTPSWLSQLLHSDLFRERLTELFNKAHDAGPITTHQRLAALADQAIEKVAEHLDDSPDPVLANAVADMALRRLGYGPKQININQTNVQNNSLATPEAIAKAARIMKQVRAALPALDPTDDTQPSAQPGIINGEFEPVPNDPVPVD